MDILGYPNFLFFSTKDSNVDAVEGMSVGNDLLLPSFRSEKQEGLESGPFDRNDRRSSDTKLDEDEKKNRTITLLMDIPRS